MQDIVIRSLSLTGNCMPSEGELRFCISLYQIFVNLDFHRYDGEDFCDSIEEYDPQTNRWREMGKLT